MPRNKRMEILAPEDRPPTMQEMIQFIQSVNPPPPPAQNNWIWAIVCILVSGLVMTGMIMGFSMIQPKPEPTPTPAPTWTPTFTPTFTPTVTHTPTATVIPKHQVVWEYYEYIRIGDYRNAEKCLDKDMRNRVGGYDGIMHKAVETGPITPVKIIPETETATGVQVLVQLYFTDEGRYRWYRFILSYDAYVREWQIATIQNYEAWATPEG